jgi:hypothetical protein
MFEVIRDALIWIMSWVLDREPEGGEALRMLFLIVFTGIATWLSFYWRDLALRSPSVRRRLLPEDRYSGRYLQAVAREDGLRYAIVNIFYNPRRRRFEAQGRNYNPSGEQVSSFRSVTVIFPSDKDGKIEFVWQGNRSNSGYTSMTVETEDEDYIEGDGAVQTFGPKPKVFPLLFKHLHEAHVKHALGVSPPVNAAEEPAFVRIFHAKLGEAVKAGFANVAEEF